MSGWKGRSAGPLGDEEGAAQETRFDGLNLRPVFRLFLLELGVPFGLAQPRHMSLTRLQPGPRDAQELRCDVGLGGLDEPGATQQLLLLPLGGGDSEGPNPAGTQVIRGGEARGDEDGAKAEPPASLQHPPGFSQHGELGPNSSENVGVNDGVEGVCLEGESGAPGQDEGRAGLEAISTGALHSLTEGGQR